MMKWMQLLWHGYAAIGAVNYVEINWVKRKK